MTTWLHVRLSETEVHHTQYVDKIEIDRDSDGMTVAVWIQDPIAVLECGKRER